MAELTAYHAWDLAFPIPVLVVTVAVARPGAGQTIPALLDDVRAAVDAEQHAQVCVAYDLRAVDLRLPLEVLMQSTAPSPKVQRVAVIGTRSRIDEMAVLIMAAAKQFPYPIRFFRSYVQAVPFLAGTERAAQPPARQVLPSGAR